jgi:hypothetical protein
MPKKPTKKKAFQKPPTLKGFKTAGTEEARHRIESALKQAQLELKMAGIDSNRFIHVNKDGSIDAELSMVEKRGMKPRDLFIKARESLPSQMAGVWISSGARFSATKDEENYHRFKGMQQAQTHYQKFTTPKRALNILTGQIVSERIEKKHRKKIDRAFVRFHWNQMGKKPGRTGGKGPVSRKDRKK